MKTSENLWFSDVFRGYQKRSVALNLSFFFFFFFFGGGDSYESGAIVFVEQLFVDTIIENHSVQPPLLHFQNEGT